MRLPKKVTLVEVGPRDGLQNEKAIIPTDIKIDFINALSKTGLTVIECTSFVSPKWVPQMADHREVLQGIDRIGSIKYPCLVPNKKGLQNAIEAGVKEIAVFTAASETFSQKNTNCSISESLKHIEEVIDLAKQNNIATRGYLSCVLGCPYEGEISPEQVTNVAKPLFELGCDEISLGDTIGVGTPGKVNALIEKVNQVISIDKIAVHFHDTYGQALANIFAALQCGIHIIDSSVAGLGGCPYAKGATGNVATEDVLYLLNGLEIETGVDINKIIQAGNIILNYLKQPTHSKAATAINKP